MNDFITMSQHICPVCGVTHEYNTEVLIDKNLKTIPDDKRVTDYGLCEEHQKLADDDYVALVECSNNIDDGTKELHQREASRTGRILHVKRKVLSEVLETDLTNDVIFATTCLIEVLLGMQENGNE